MTVRDWGLIALAVFVIVAGAIWLRAWWQSRSGGPPTS